MHTSRAQVHQLTPGTMPGIMRNSTYFKQGKTLLTKALLFLVSYSSYLKDKGKTGMETRQDQKMKEAEKLPQCFSTRALRKGPFCVLLMSCLYVARGASSVHPYLV